MYEEFDKQQLELKPLQAKESVFRFVAEYLCARQFDNNDHKLYFWNYCESIWEKAFNVLEIPDDAIEEFEFYKLWEENNKKIWTAYGNNNEIPESWTAQWMYDNRC